MRQSVLELSEVPAGHTFGAFSSAKNKNHELWILPKLYLRQKTDRQNDIPRDRIFSLFTVIAVRNREKNNVNSGYWLKVKQGQKNPAIPYQ